MITFQQIILRLQDYWDKQGCALLQPYDMEVGAGTSHTATFLRALGPEPWKAAYVQPSTNESFSRTIMEAWLAETVVVASGASDVVTWHCERSGGGLVYADELELGQCLRFVAEAPEKAAQLARKGRDYVLANYRWPSVLDAMERSLEGLL